MSGWHWFATGVSPFADNYDRLFYFMLALCGVVWLAVNVTIIAFMFRYYHKREVPRTGTASVERIIEYSWIGIPLFLFIVVFVWGATLYANLFYPPADAMPVYVTGKQWMWKIQHAGGQREYNQLHVPVNRPVVLIITSEDVIHDFFLPQFRIKRDAVPGRYNKLWFTATRTGSYDIFCGEYCGTNHSDMAGRLVVMSQNDFAAWLEKGARNTLAQQGEALFRAHGCSGCHGANATIRAPSLEGVFNRAVPLDDGTTKLADESYIRDSILLPRKDIVAGYAPVMPSFRGQLSEDEIMKLIAYIKSLSPEGRS